MNRSMRRRVSRNDQYFQLWQRILLRLTESMERGQQDEDLAQLASELEQAQQQGRLPAALVRKLTQEPHRGSPRQA